MSLRSSRCDTLGRAVRRNCRSCASVKQTATILLERGGECTFFLPTAWARTLNSGHLHEACAKIPEARVFAPFGVLLRRPTRRPTPKRGARRGVWHLALDARRGASFPDRAPGDSPPVRLRRAVCGCPVVDRAWSVRCLQGAGLRRGVGGALYNRGERRKPARAREAGLEWWRARRALRKRSPVHARQDLPPPMRRATGRGE